MRNVSPSGRSPGAGMAAKWTTASAPASASWVWPRSVRSVTRVFSVGWPSGRTSTLRTSWPWSRRSRTTNAPPLPVPPVTTIRMPATSATKYGQTDKASGLQRRIEDRVAAAGEVGPGDFDRDVRRESEPRIAGRPLVIPGRDQHDALAGWHSHDLHVGVHIEPAARRFA